MREYAEVPSQMAALVHFLLECGPISRLVDDKVFVAGIPKDEIKSSASPMNCINIATVPSVGGMDGSEAPRDKVRVNIFSYGEDPITAERIDLAVLVPLRALRGAVISFGPEDADLVYDVEGKIYIKNATYGGYFHGRDYDTDWPYVRRGYEICFGQEVG